MRKQSSTGTTQVASLHSDTLMMFPKLDMFSHHPQGILISRECSLPKRSSSAAWYSVPLARQHRHSSCSPPLPPSPGILTHSPFPAPATFSQLSWLLDRSTWNPTLLACPGTDVQLTNEDAAPRSPRPGSLRGWLWAGGFPACPTALPCHSQAPDLIGPETSYISSSSRASLSWNV